MRNIFMQQGRMRVNPALLIGCDLNTLLMFLLQVQEVNGECVYVCVRVRVCVCVCMCVCVWKRQFISMKRLYVYIQFRLNQFFDLDVLSTTQGHHLRTVQTELSIVYQKSKQQLFCDKKLTCIHLSQTLCFIIMKLAWIW